MKGTQTLLQRKHLEKDLERMRTKVESDCQGLKEVLTAFHENFFMKSVKVLHISVNEKKP